MNQKHALIFVLYFIQLSNSSPIVQDFNIPWNFCLLPPELDYVGTVKFVEDCPSLDRYKTIPIPGDYRHKLGTHPVVCCPKYLPESSIQEYDDDTPIVTDPTTSIQETTKMADNKCNHNGQYNTLPGIGELSQCVPLNRCGKILDSDTAPQTQVQPCGFDEDNSIMMICCPEDYVTATPDKMQQQPRFPQNGRARRVTDVANKKECRKWKKNDGCTG